MRNYCKVILLFLSFLITNTYSQKKTSEEIATLITSYKADIRGPYERINWFCKDGSRRNSKDPCPDEENGGLQHASFKSSVLKLRETNNLYFTEILAGLNIESFLDEKENFSRLKQYQLSKYLASINNGWILQKAQFYRGAIQSEDEENWGKSFYENILKNEALVNSNFYLIRQSLKDIPHNGDSNLGQLMRSESKILAEVYPSFMEIRIKIHGNPQRTDIGLVKEFLQKNDAKLKTETKKSFDKMLLTMEQFYAPLDFKKLNDIAGKIKSNKKIVTELQNYFSNYKNLDSPKNILIETASILSSIRFTVSQKILASDKLILLDLSNLLETNAIIESENWETETLQETVDKLETLTCAAFGTGLLELWEFNEIENQFNTLKSKQEITVDELNNLLTLGRNIVEWSSSLIKANYYETVIKYTAFEPLAYGFTDDRIRNSIALNLGKTVSKLGEFVTKKSNLKNAVFNLQDVSAMRGLNPGYAFGQLVVIDGNPDDVEVNSNNIYVFLKPPIDLKPVAGIMTVSEGNLVSHVQLLARNLGIPNAALSNDNLKKLKEFNGKKVFYAVSNKGNVILKLEENMTKEEKLLFEKQVRNTNMIEVPIENIRLDVTKVVNMRTVNATDSGRLCGPKAANLGELKQLFPNQVVEGLIIPFGVFKEHMNLPMPNENKTYWQYLTDTFVEATKKRDENKSETEVETFMLKSLEKLHTSILKIELKQSFITDLKSNFKTAFKSDIGKVPVFLRSDTNMEDLKEFTGAGLNLTLFNILEEQKIIEGIKRVWASAYTERSFKWRQKYLLNPENVYPSILIIPSVDVDYSGVLITKGINLGTDTDLTVAVSKGAGGAVDGQSAETRLITANGNILLAPARQSDYNRLPITGGTKKYFTSFDAPILNELNMNDIRVLAKNIREKIGEKSTENDVNQVYDVEFGFKNNKLWLFQIRPFVENKRAKSSEYLNSIAPKTVTNKKINMSEKLN
ncbi:PEP/pyruvate-binding domain-containing protein [Polaribacter glomeratus]|uniref:Phosphoenolpyruvate synthase n=1 Tax=Polaribacter glomeratus TaxID=102 RepID=A0A2S7WXK9_9FLAO|nr:PEP/pyruvate-binding domain-containing protein [Polaribacter glomeratus]PQJ82303.1 phosphoenolpyruvate synthase [Polaribacter glomeratus]TXD66896.1 phosphoenolpyruvate synthase [Polaribacter glomeratus]